MRAGKVRVLAVMGGSRYEAIPDVPTIGELLPGYEPPPGWSGILGPAKLPAPILGRLHADITRVLDSKESRAEQAKIFTQTAISASPEEFAAKIRREVELVGQIVKRAGIQPLD
jgi:tripartite-type tricarboxylate transporter receptor subunit TctC